MMSGLDERRKRQGVVSQFGEWRVRRSAISTGDGEHFGDEIILWNGSGNCLTNNSEDGLNQELSYPTILQSDAGDLNIAFTLHRRAIAISYTL